MAKGGRPSKYSERLAKQICEGIAGGKLLPQVCKEPGMPGVSTVWRWISDYPSFRDNYARAKEIQCEIFAAETLDLAERPVQGSKIKKFKKGRKTVTEETTGDAVERSRLAVDTRKWLLSHMFPKKYGNRVEFDTGDGRNESMNSLKEQATRFYQQQKADGEDRGIQPKS